MRRIALVLLALAAILAGCMAPASSPTRADATSTKAPFTLTVHVIQAFGPGLQGARVDLETDAGAPMVAYADASGDAVFALRNVTRFTATASADGWVSEVSIPIAIGVARDRPIGLGGVAGKIQLALPPRTIDQNESVDVPPAVHSYADPEAAKWLPRPVKLFGDAAMDEYVLNQGYRLRSTLTWENGPSATDPTGSGYADPDLGFGCSSGRIEAFGRAEKAAVGIQAVSVDFTGHGCQQILVGPVVQDASTGIKGQLRTTLTFLEGHPVWPLVLA